MNKIEITEDLHSRLCDYVSRDLRNRFDDAYEAGDPFRMITIIDHTREFGFDKLAQEMIYDLCLEDNAKFLWNIHENKIANEELGLRDFERIHDEAYK